MDTTISTQPIDSWNEADQLISSLRLWGIEYLVGEHVPINPSESEKSQQSAVTLIKRLAQCQYPRVRDASISLFLLHPELAGAVLEALQTSQPEVAEQIAILTLATLYLQRLWSIRLVVAMGHPPGFSEQFFTALWHNRHLPPPAYHDGKWGLTLLQEFEQRRSGFFLNYLDDWQNQVDHLLLQKETQYHEGEVMVSPVWLVEEDLQYEQESEMSMRPNVDKGQIENFLKSLGRTFRKPGRLYLVGGAALVHAGLRPGSTQDIDVEVRAADEDEMVNVIRQLKDTLKINVEFASPGDFIPLPDQWEMSAKYIARYGSVDVFYFDFYSIALSKIQRGSTRDINDVKLLLQQKVITLEGLDTAYNEILPRVGKRPYNRLDPAQFAKRYTDMRQMF